MSLLNVERAIEAMTRMLDLDQTFRETMARAVAATGKELDRCEAQLAALDPQLQRARADLARALVTIKQSYADRVTVPVRTETHAGGTLVGTLAWGGPQVEGRTVQDVTRRLQELIDQGSH